MSKGRSPQESRRGNEERRDEGGVLQAFEKRIPNGRRKPVEGYEEILKPVERGAHSHVEL